MAYRAWGRTYAEGGSYTWTPVVTDPVTGDNTAVRVTQLIQVLKMDRNESPFFANYGIPARLSVVQQIFPDVFVFQTQAQFSPFFASLIISPLASSTPTYLVNIVTFSGESLSMQVPI